MAAYCRAIWDCRFFWLSLVRMDLRTRYRGSALGMGWSLLNPIVMTLVVSVVVSSIAKMSVWEYFPFLIAGLTFWNYVVGVTQGGCHCFRQGESYIRQYPAPMAIYPLRCVLGGAFHYCVALSVVIVTATIMHHGIQPLSLLSLIPGLVLLIIMGWSVAVILGLLNLRFRDTSHIMDIVLQITFYMTPVLYPEESVAGTRLEMLLPLNPLMPFLRLLRDPIFTGQMPTPATFLSAGVVVAIFATAATVALYKQERRLVFHL